MKFVVVLMLIMLLIVLLEVFVLLMVVVDDGDIDGISGCQKSYTSSCVRLKRAGDAGEEV